MKNKLLILPFLASAVMVSTTVFALSSRTPRWNPWNATESTAVLNTCQSSLPICCNLWKRCPRDPRYFCCHRWEICDFFPLPTTAITKLVVQNNTSGKLGLNKANEMFSNISDSDFSPSLSTLNTSNPWTGYAKQIIQGVDYDFSIPFVSPDKAATCTLDVNYDAHIGKVGAQTINTKVEHFQCDAQILQQGSDNVILVTFKTI